MKARSNQCWPWLRSPYVCGWKSTTNAMLSKRQLNWMDPVLSSGQNSRQFSFSLFVERNGSSIDSVIREISNGNRTLHYRKCGDECTHEIELIHRHNVPNLNIYGFSLSATFDNILFISTCLNNSLVFYSPAVQNMSCSICLDSRRIDVCEVRKIKMEEAK